MVPLLALHPDQDEASQESGQERYPEIDENTFRDLPYCDLLNCIVHRQAEPSRQYSDENISIYREEENLED